MEKKNPITAISDRVCWVEKQITWIAFIVMLGLLVIQVACRYCFHFPLAWSEELVRFILSLIHICFAAPSRQFPNFHTSTARIAHRRKLFYNVTPSRKIPIW